MKEILLFGAGKSATVLIDYLLENAAVEQWRVTVVDADLQLALSKINGSEYGEALSFDISQPEKRAAVVTRADLVISMLPPTLHRLVAESCLKFSKHLLTASYVDDHMRALESELLQKGIIFLCEMGLDPGIDHMSAMQIIHNIHSQGGTIHSFASHCGGLIAPESDDNPWHYKISWNPRNIVMAGSSGAVYKKGNQTVKLGYNELFEGSGRVSVPGLDPFAWYANRDSLSYIALYGLGETADFLRTTLRHPAFMKGWDAVVKAGLSSEIPFAGTTAGLSYAAWVDQQLALHTSFSNLNEFLSAYGDPAKTTLVHDLFNWLGLTSTELVPQSAKCPADILQVVLESKLQLLPGDRDMIVMLHEFGYRSGEQLHTIKSSLVVKGNDSRHTAMAKTVGLPLGIAARLILNGTITMKGLCIPVYPEIYEPVLEELATRGVRFIEVHERQS